ncbi:hypothetical protein PR202_gb09662 [Eleusine coracana subsp. coracana]|uniref:RING-type E3 ubiquitin transferase n=1 Tax=Eleusine coracana subsp. coracana TaxID=191504 RepID=A0AAV5EIX0_ELECO|nr:hypothetical protein PR202_gb09662 [Eleusine coracana subsp. coracana]
MGCTIIVGVLLTILVCVCSASSVAAQQAPGGTGDSSSENGSDPPGVGIKVSFRPSVAIVVGIFAMIFSLTFLLLMYAKFCHPSSSSSSSSSSSLVPAITRQQQQVSVSAAANNQQQEKDGAGVPKSVIESLPFFRFSTLRGARQGMECSVCLSRFDDAHLLRLLPRCRHAFHLDCVDRWLQSNASCPLCRAAIHADDATLGLKYAASARIVFGGGDDDDLHGGDGGDRESSSNSSSRRRERDLLDIFVERVPSSRFVDSPLDRHRHRIIVSDVVFKNRWSELNSADLIALDTEMLRSSAAISFFPPSPSESTSNSFPSLYLGDKDNNSNKILLSSGGEAQTQKAQADTTDKTKLLLQGTNGTTNNNNVIRATSSLLSAGVRSVSEIVSLPRLLTPSSSAATREDDNRRWLPIAHRTVRRFAGRTNKHQHHQQQEEEGVHVAPVVEESVLGDDFRV